MLNMEVGNSDSLAGQIKAQGDLVRRLKQEKADKDKVRYHSFELIGEVGYRSGLFPGYFLY